jgi:phage tail protein X
MYLYFLFRKIVYSLLILAGIGVVVLLGRAYFQSPEEQPVAKFPVQSPTQQETEVTSPLLEKKLDLLKEEAPTTKTESNPTGPAEDSVRRLSAALSAKTEPKPTVPPPTIETKPTPAPPVLEVKPPVSAPLKVIKKEPRINEAKKESKPKETTPKIKANPPDTKKPESKNSIKPSDHKTVTVKVGDSIYTIAAENYKVSNTSVVDRIMALNPKIADPDLLPANQKITLPEINEESLVIQSSDAAVKVRLGTFMKPEYAHFLKGHPALQGKNVEIVPWKTPSGKTLYRATAGKFETREEGLQVIRDLREKGLSPYFEGFKKKN